MDIKRRTLIKGITATAAVTWAASPQVFAAPLREAITQLRQSTATSFVAKPIIAVTHEDLVNSAFMAGVAAAQPRELHRLKSADYASLAALIGQTHSNLLGLIDHSNAAILVQLARHQGAKVHWLGQHTATASGMSHNIVKSGNTDACHSKLFEDLIACPTRHYVREQGIAARMIAGQGAQHPQQWAANLGLLLSDWRNPHPAFAALQLTAVNDTAPGSFVSFFIETC